MRLTPARCCISWVRGDWRALHPRLGAGLSAAGGKRLAGKPPCLSGASGRGAGGYPGGEADCVRGEAAGEVDVDYPKLICKNPTLIS